MTLIFDYDGTLHNTAHLYGCAVRAVCEWLKQEGYPVPDDCSDKRLSGYLGVSAPDMWRDFMTELPDERKQQAAERVGAEMRRGVLAGNAALYPGTAEMLDQLKMQGYRMVILSNCGSHYLEPHRQVFQLDTWFSGYYCAADFDYAPKKDIFNIIRQDYPDEAYVGIGDRASDFQVGLTHGFPVIGCAYGYGTAEERKPCTVVARSPAEIPGLLKNVEKDKKRA